MGSWGGERVPGGRTRSRVRSPDHHRGLGASPPRRPSHLLAHLHHLEQRWTCGKVLTEPFGRPSSWAHHALVFRQIMIIRRSDIAASSMLAALAAKPLSSQTPCLESALSALSPSLKPSGSSSGPQHLAPRAAPEPLRRAITRYHCCCCRAWGGS